MEEKFDKVLSFLVSFQAEMSEFKGEMRDGFASLEGRFLNLEGRFTDLEGRFLNLEGRFTDLEGRLTKIEDRLDRLENDVAYLRKNTVTTERFKLAEKQLAMMSMELSEELRAVAAKIDRLSIEIYDTKTDGARNKVEISSLKDRVLLLEETVRKISLAN